MKSIKFNIVRWDSIMGNCVVPKPMIYIYPNEELLELYNSKIFLQIFSNCVYDRQIITGTLLKSSDISNRVNFFKETGLYVIVLNAEWRGYPPTLGECEIYLNNFS